MDVDVHVVNDVGHDSCRKGTANALGIASLSLLTLLSLSLSMGIGGRTDCISTIAAVSPSMIPLS